MPVGPIALPPLARVCAAFAPRLTDFAAEPGFVAEVDQHAAEISEYLSPRPADLDVPPPSAEDLSDYALGFLDALDEIGWVEPLGHDWAVARLTAICWLVREHRLCDVV